MKFYALIIFLFLAFNFPTMNISAKSKTDSAENVLKKVSDKLSKLKTLNYTFQRKLNFESIGFVSNMQIESFLDFTSTDKFIVTSQAEKPSMRCVDVNRNGYEQTGFIRATRQKINPPIWVITSVKK